MAQPTKPGIGKVSKMHRTGVKQVQRTVQCLAGHVMTSVLVIGSGMRRLCACTGYAPIDASRPYLSLKAPEAIGKACLPRKDAGSYPQGSAA